MKTTKSALVATLIIFLSLISVSTYANNSNNIKLNNMKELKTMHKNGLQDIKEQRYNLREENKQRMTEAKQNFSNFKQENGKIEDAFSELDEDTTNELKELYKKRAEETKELRLQLNNKDLGLEAREELRNKIRETNEEYADKIKEIVSDNEKASTYIENRQELAKQNMSLRLEANQAKKQLREEHKELVIKYKQNYINRLSAAIPKIKDEKLTQIDTKIADLITKTEENTKINQETKDKFLSQLIGLKEIIEEEIETREDSELEIDLDEIFE